MTGDANRGVTAELYIRSLAPRGAADRQATVLTALETLTDRQHLSDVTVYVCGNQIPATPADTRTDFGEFLLNRIAVFTAWAERNDRSLEPLYERQTIDSTLTGTTQDVINLPVLALAEYEGTDLRYVTPCRVEGEILTVQERLAELTAESEEEEPRRLSDARTDPPESDVQVAGETTSQRHLGPTL